MKIKIISLLISLFVSLLVLFIEISTGISFFIYAIFEGDDFPSRIIIIVICLFAGIVSYFLSNNYLKSKEDPN